MMVLEEIGKSPYPEMEEILSSPRDKIGTKLDNLPREEAAVVGGSEEHQEKRPEPCLRVCEAKAELRGQGGQIWDFRNIQN